jgi:hypothetical protein
MAQHYVIGGAIVEGWRDGRAFRMSRRWCAEAVLGTAHRLGLAAGVAQ